MEKNRARYERLLKMLSKRNLLKNDPYGVAGFVKRLSEELSRPVLANETINIILDKITREGKLPEETQRVYDEIRSNFGAQDSDNGNYAKSDIWGSSKKLWRY